MANNEPMTAERRAAIKARCDAATPGPWVVDLPDWGECNGISSKNGTQILNAGSCIPDPQTAVDYGGTVHDWKEEPYDYGVHKWDDAVFIAHAREDVPALLAEVERWQRVARYLAKKLTHDDGSENSGLPGGKWMGAAYDDCCSLYSSRDEAVQSWIDEAEMEVGNERN